MEGTTITQKVNKITVATVCRGKSACDCSLTLVYAHLFLKVNLFGMLNFLTRFLFPHNCILCKTDSNQNLDLCADCAKDLPYRESVCPRCGEIIENNAAINIARCGSCLNEELPYQCVCAPFHYQDSVAKLIVDLKFNQKLLYAKLLGTLMASFLENHYIGKEKPQLIIPVPLHEKRLKERGFNQALEIARPISKRLRIPIDKYNCLRIKNTVAQSSLKLKERKQNVKKAFFIKKSLNVQYVAIIDDVMTTGNTVKELSQILKNSGIMSVDIWCLTKTANI